MTLQLPVLKLDGIDDGNRQLGSVAENSKEYWWT